MQHRLLRRIAKVNIKKAHIALQAGIGQGAIVVRVFPGPDIGALGALGQGAIGVFPRVHQGDIALVGLFLLVQQRQNAVRARQAHNHHVHLVGHLADGAGKLFGHV